MAPSRLHNVQTKKKNVFLIMQLSQWLHTNPWLSTALYTSCELLHHFYMILSRWFKLELNTDKTGTFCGKINVAQKKHFQNYIPSYI